VDEDGNYAIVDRKKDLIIRGGFNVYPREVEEVLYEHPAVAEAAVIGTSRPQLGEDVAAAVALKPGGTATPEELREHVKSQVVAQQLAHQTPHLVGRLVLAATGPGLGGVPGSPAVLWSLATPRRYHQPDYFRRIAGRVYGGMARRDPDALLHGSVGQFVERPSISGYLGQLYAISGWTSLPWLHRLQQPTLVLAGDDDPIVPLVSALPGQTDPECTAACHYWRWSSVHTRTPGGDGRARRRLPRPRREGEEMRTVTVAELPNLEGASLGSGPWREISQDQINRFADATTDHQWIHVDPARAATGPFGRTIAHGYLTLSLIPALLDDLLHVNGAGQAINYGLDKARFPAPVPVGSRVRLKAVVERSIPCPRDSNLRSLSPSSATL
jgi:acyl dehydratase